MSHTQPEDYIPTIHPIRKLFIFKGHKAHTSFTDEFLSYQVQKYNGLNVQEVNKLISNNDLQIFDDVLSDSMYQSTGIDTKSVWNNGYQVGHALASVEFANLVSFAAAEIQHDHAARSIDKIFANASINLKFQLHFLVLDPRVMEGVHNELNRICIKHFNTPAISRVHRYSCDAEIKTLIFTPKFGPNNRPEPVIEMSSYKHKSLINNRCDHRKK